MILRRIGTLLTLMTGTWLSVHATAPTAGMIYLERYGPPTAPPARFILPIEPISDWRPNQQNDYPQPFQKLALSIQVFVAEDIHFPVNSSKPDNMGTVELKKLTSDLSKYPTATVVCTGHTDDTGSEAYNLALGLRRAQAVKEFMVAAGIPAENITVNNCGESEPSVPNDSATNRALNRRVSLEFGWRPDTDAQANHRSLR